MAGNVRGVTKIKADGLTAPPAENKVAYYTIVSGDTLSKLARKYYGDAGAYPRIFEANREVIKDPDLIYVGQKIRIPRKIRIITFYKEETLWIWSNYSN